MGYGSLWPTGLGESAQGAVPAQEERSAVLPAMPVAAEGRVMAIKGDGYWIPRRCRCGSEFRQHTNHSTAYKAMRRCSGCAEDLWRRVRHLGVTMRRQAIERDLAA